MKHGKPIRPAFTLVELLVVIAIIGILISLLLPAAGMVRENGRLTACRNNLKQIGAGVKGHVATQRHYPTGGWGHMWLGDPDRGYKEQQPGGWAYNVLEFMEQTNIRNIGRGMTDADKRVALKDLKMAVIPIFICPSRRTAKQYPAVEGSYNSDASASCSKTDYAGNGGREVQTFSGPGTLAEGDSATYNWPANMISSHTGVTHLRSKVTDAHIRDGSSNTYFAGEKFLPPEKYETGDDGADNNAAFQGHDWDILRWGNKSYPPIPDRQGVQSYQSFGSAHSRGCNFVFCDGSVSLVSFAVDPNIHERLGNRNDGGGAVDRNDL